MALFGSKKVQSDFAPNAEIVVHRGETLDFLRTIPDKTFQLIITSPPYNLGKEYEKKIGIKKYLETQECVIVEMIRTLKSTGSICWQVGNFVDDGEVFPLDIFYYDIFKKHN